MVQRKLRREWVVCTVILAALAASSLFPTRPCQGGGCELCFTAGGCNLHVTSVKLGDSIVVLEGMGKDETVLTVELNVISGDTEKVSACRADVDVWVTDEHGQRNSSRAATTFRNAKSEITSIQWLFAVPKNSRSFCLNFPGGEALDLAPFFQ